MVRDPMPGLRQVKKIKGISQEIPLYFQQNTKLKTKTNIFDTFFIFKSGCKPQVTHNHRVIVMFYYFYSKKKNRVIVMDVGYS